MHACLNTLTHTQRPTFRLLRGLRILALFLVVLMFLLTNILPCLLAVLHSYAHDNMYVYLSIHLSNYLIIDRSICLSIYESLSIYLLNMTLI